MFKLCIFKFIIIIYLSVFQEVVNEDVEIPTTDGYEDLIQGHYETFDDTYEPLNNQHKDQGNCDKPAIHMYANTTSSN